MKIDEFQDSFTLLEENSLGELKYLCKRYAITRQKVHDTNIVATMMKHGISSIATFNRKDFIGFDEIEIFELNKGRF